MLIYDVYNMLKKRRRKFHSTYKVEKNVPSLQMLALISITARLSYSHSMTNNKKICSQFYLNYLPTIPKYLCVNGSVTRRRKYDVCTKFISYKYFECFLVIRSITGKHVCSEYSLKKDLFYFYSNCCEI
jgi:hypothetical protein